MSLIETTTDTRVFRTRRADMAMLAPQRWDEAVDEITRRLMEHETGTWEETRAHVEADLRGGRAEVAGVIYQVAAQKRRKVVFR